MLNVTSQWQVSEPCSRGRQCRQDGEEALQRQQVHGAERAVDGEGGLGQQGGDGLEQVVALDPAVQVQVYVADERQLVAEVQHTLHAQKIP